MARTVLVFPMAYLPDVLFNDIHAYLLSEGYEYTQYQNEYVFKKGKGLAMGPTFIKVSAQNNAVYLEAWLKFAVLPGVYAGESGLDGLTGAAVKGPLKKRFAHIESMIRQYAGDPVPGAAYPPPSFAAYPPPDSAAYPPSSSAAYPPPGAAAYPPPVQPGANNFCAHCGSPLAPGAAFCTNCGSAV